MSDPDDAVAYWLTRQALEQFRMKFYGDIAAGGRVQRVLKVLGSNGVEYLLIGGYAVGILSIFRLDPCDQPDLEVWVRLSPASAKTIRLPLCG